MFSDHANCVVSVLNLASLRELEKAVGRPVDPTRFRANLHIDGAEPWEEFSWAEREIAIGDVRFTVTVPIDRCAATNVNTDTAARDMNLPQDLKRHFGHVNFGVYARVESAGTVRVGDEVSPPR